MTGEELLRALAEADDQEVDNFFQGMSAGMFDEWDCEPAEAMKIFGPAEFKIAARTGAGWLAHHATVDSTAAEDEEPDGDEAVDVFKDPDYDQESEAEYARRTEDDPSGPAANRAASEWG